MSSREEEARQGRMNAMQMEALGIVRRERITTDESRHEAKQYRPVGDLEQIRLARGRQPQTYEETTKVSAWNAIHQVIGDDGTVTEELADVNEGLGQTHRAKLMKAGNVSISEVRAGPSRASQPARGRGQPRAGPRSHRGSSAESPRLVSVHTSNRGRLTRSAARRIAIGRRPRAEEEESRSDPPPATNTAKRPVVSVDPNEQAAHRQRSTLREAVGLVDPSTFMTVAANIAAPASSSNVSKSAPDGKPPSRLPTGRHPLSHSRVRNRPPSPADSNAATVSTSSDYQAMVSLDPTPSPKSREEEPPSSPKPSSSSSSSSQDSIPLQHVKNMSELEIVLSMLNIDQRKKYASAKSMTELDLAKSMLDAQQSEKLTKIKAKVKDVKDVKEADPLPSSSNERIKFTSGSSSKAPTMPARSPTPAQSLFTSGIAPDINAALIAAYTSGIKKENLAPAQSQAPAQAQAQATPAAAETHERESSTTTTATQSRPVGNIFGEALYRRPQESTRGASFSKPKTADDASHKQERQTSGSKGKQPAVGEREDANSPSDAINKGKKKVAFAETPQPTTRKEDNRPSSSATRPANPPASQGTTNPFGPARSRSRRTPPSLPAHLQGREPPKDHGEEARRQYGA